MKAVREIRHPSGDGVTLASVIREGMKVCLVFPHGLGDIVMFRPVLDRLRSLYPKTVIHMMVKPDYPELDDHNESIEYDLAFWLDYYMALPAKGETKNGRCCREELGISQPLDDRPKAPGGFRSPWVGIGCTSVCFPEMFAPSAWEAKQINDGVIEAGFIPLDTAMMSKPGYFTRRSPMAVDLRSVPGTYSKLAGIIERCHAFIGTLSGAYHVAQSLLPGRTLLLCPRAGEWRRLYRNAPLHVNMRDITKETIRDWLLSLPETP